MRYRSFEDRKVSTYLALLIITIFGAGATMMIIRAADAVKFSETNLAQIVN